MWFAVGVLIFWRRSDDRMALLVSLFLVAFGTVAVDTTDADALVSSQPAWWLPVQSVDITGAVCVVLFFGSHQDGHIHQPRRSVVRGCSWKSPHIGNASSVLRWHHD